MKPTDPVVPLLNPLDPRVPAVIAKLREAESECEELIKEVEEYDWDHEAYPLLAGCYPYPEKDMDRFHERAREARDLKTRIVAVLHSLGAVGDPWQQLIEKTDFYERYELSNPFYTPKRPSVSGLTAARQVLTTAIQTLCSAYSPSEVSPPTGQPRSMGSPEAVKACQRYMYTKGLNQEQFGQRFQTSDKTVRKFLADGKIRKSLFCAMAEAMDLSPEQLLRGEWPRPS